jgi:RHS repeat-associated protein
MVVIATELSSTGGVINDNWSYLDRFDRAIVGKTRLLSGDYNRVDREFDSLGRVRRESAPCLSSSCTNYWTTHYYDLIGRATAVSRPVSESNPALQTTDIFHEGLTRRIRDPQSKNAMQIHNAAGQVARSQDHDGYYQSFAYDAFGNLKRVLDQLGNPLQSSTYNLRGMLTARTDMDMGAWSFTPNALGETVSQTDAEGQIITFGFDLLGRHTTRADFEGTNTWVWGTSSAQKNIGQLASLSGTLYSEDFTYNTLGQMVTKLITVGGSPHQYDYAYNAEGTLDQITYPTSPSSYRLKLKFEYQNGVMNRIRDFNALSTVFWSADATNARNQITQETLNNGLVTNRTTDAVTGWLKSIQTGVGGGTGVQHLEYQWDLAGNLKKRIDGNQSGLTEEFFYDNLNRLDYSERNGVENLNMGYDALGNISSKSDVGNYFYDPTKKHQVTSTSNGWSFAYDDNGNMTSGRGATITWTSSNYPASITSGSNTTSFNYTPSLQYWRQVSNYTSGGAATTLYIGGLLEKVATSAGDDYRHMIRAGSSTIIVSRRTSGVNSTSYVTNDHLGSSSAITDPSGGGVVNLSFDAFGKRRGSSWAGGPSAGDWAAIAATTRRGFTEHSMLDNLGLIHMNGRVQDPVLGRFISADPYIPNPVNTQEYNRYSYLANNPLSSTDSTGFYDDDWGWEPCYKTAAGQESCWYGNRRMATACFTYACLYVGGQIGLGSEIARSQAARHSTQERGNDVQRGDSVASWLGSCPIGDWEKMTTQIWEAQRQRTALQESSHAFMTGVGELASALGWPTEKLADGTYVNPATGYDGMTVVDRQTAVGASALAVVMPVTRGVPSASSIAVGVPTNSLIRTHGQTMSGKQLQKLTQNIASNGIREPVNYVNYGGEKFIVDGHHRVIAARKLGMENVPAVEVSLPFRGYQSEIDLLGGGGW